MANSSYSASMAKMWAVLVVGALAWGVLTGIALAKDIWLDPASAIFGCFGIFVIAASLLVAIVRRKN